MNTQSPEIQAAYTNAQIRASLHRMQQREAEARKSTGEPCRCPESQLHCICGAYDEVA